MAEEMRIGLSLNEPKQVNWFQGVESLAANVWAPHEGASSDLQ